MLLSVALVRADVSEELSASIIRVTRIGEIRTTLAVTSNRHKRSWLQTQSSRVRFPALPDFLSSNGSGTESIQPRQRK
jgi:hypothetical protein